MPTAFTATMYNNLFGKLGIVALLWALSMAQGLAQTKTVTTYNLGPGDVLLDANLIRGQVSYRVLGLKAANGYPARSARTVGVKAEFQLFSSKMDRFNHFVVYDALYTDLAMGVRTSETLPAEFLLSDGKEDKLAYQFSFGYDIYLGYRNTQFGLLGGLRPAWMGMSIGNMNGSGTTLDLFTFSAPLAIRGEWRPASHFEFRFIAMAWAGGFGTRRQGIRLEAPFYPKWRWWVFAEYESADVIQENVAKDGVFNGTATSFQVGFRWGSVF